MTPAVRRVLRFIDANLTEKRLSLSELGEVAELSSGHFCQTFRAQTGQSPRQFVLAKRIERAQFLLGAGERTADVAYFCGYSSQQHFASSFRRKTGLTPNQYRRQRGQA